MLLVCVKEVLLALMGSISAFTGLQVLRRLFFQSKDRDLETGGFSDADRICWSFRMLEVGWFLTDDRSFRFSMDDRILMVF
jgi:hypothetical protein